MTPTLRDIEGLDLEDAHLRIDSDELLAELLPDFAARWADGAERIGSALAAARTEDAERAAHGLAGVAGTLGLTEVAAVALRLEVLLGAGASAEAAAEVPALAAALDRVVTSIQRVLGDRGSAS